MSEMSIVFVENEGLPETLAERLARLEAKVAERGGSINRHTITEPRGYLKLKCETRLAPGFYLICRGHDFAAFERHDAPAPVPDY